MKALEMAPKLNIIISSTRPGRVGPVIANWFQGYAKDHGAFDAHLVDLAAFELPVFDEPKHPVMQAYEHEHTKRWAASVAAGDAFVFVMPEYDYFAPASLINAVQYLSREWNYKAASFVSYGGVSGGLRSVQSIKPLFTSLKMVPIPEQVTIPMFPQNIQDGVFVANEMHLKGAKDALDELARWTGALAALRTK